MGLFFVYFLCDVFLYIGKMCARIMAVATKYHGDMG